MIFIDVHNYGLMQKMCHATKRWSIEDLEQRMESESIDELAHHLPYLVSEFNADGMGIAHIAAKYLRFDAFKLSITCGVDLKKRDRFDRSSLYLLAMRGRLAVGTGGNGRSELDSLYSDALSCVSPGAVDVQYRNSISGITIPDILIRGHFNKSVGWYLDNGFNISSVDQMGHHLGFGAVASGNVLMVERCISMGINPESADGDISNSMLGVACILVRAKERESMIKMLIRYGANPFPVLNAKLKMLGSGNHPDGIILKEMSRVASWSNRSSRFMEARDRISAHAILAVSSGIAVEHAENWLSGRQGV